MNPLNLAERGGALTRSPRCSVWSCPASRVCRSCRPRPSALPPGAWEAAVREGATSARPTTRADQTKTTPKTPHAHRPAPTTDRPRSPARPSRRTNTRRAREQTHGRDETRRAYRETPLVHHVTPPWCAHGASCARRGRGRSALVQHRSHPTATQTQGDRAGRTYRYHADPPPPPKQQVECILVKCSG